VVILVTCGGLRTREPEGIGTVRIAGQQRSREPVDRWRARPCGKPGLGWVVVGGVGIGGEVVIERDVLLEDHDHVIDRSFFPLRSRDASWHVRGDRQRGCGSNEPDGAAHERVLLDWTRASAASAVEASGAALPIDDSGMTCRHPNCGPTRWC